MSLSSLLEISPSIKDELDEIVRRDFGMSTIAPEISTNPYEDAFHRFSREKKRKNPTYHDVYILYVGLKALDVALWHFEKIQSAQHVREVQRICFFIQSRYGTTMPGNIKDILKKIETKYGYFSSRITLTGKIGYWVNNFIGALSPYMR